MIENWKDVQIVPEFCDQGVDCYRLEGGHFLNEYYIVSEAETRKLMNHPEVVGYEVYASLVTATSQMMYYLKEKKKITSANILSILRGALNYPLEERAATKSTSASTTSALCRASAFLKMAR